MVIILLFTDIAIITGACFRLFMEAKLKNAKVHFDDGAFSQNFRTQYNTTDEMIIQVFVLGMEIGKLGIETTKQKQNSLRITIICRCIHIYHNTML